MKKIISAFLSIAMLFSICCTSVVFAEETVKTGMTSANDTIAWSYDTATKTITFSIAEGQTGTTWSGIGNANASGYKDYVSAIEKVVVSEGITRVGPGAFAYSVPNLKEVTLPSTLTEVGDNAFNSCSKLARLNFKPAAECRIGTFAFNATGFVNLVIPEGVTSVGSYAFNNLQGSLKSLYLPSTLTTIGEKAFRNAGKLEKVVIPKEITSIPTDAFFNAGFNGLDRKTKFYVVRGSAGETFAENVNSYDTTNECNYTYELIDYCDVTGTFAWQIKDSEFSVTEGLGVKSDNPPTATGLGYEGELFVGETIKLSYEFGNTDNKSIAFIMSEDDEGALRLEKYFVGNSDIDFELESSLGRKTLRMIVLPVDGTGNYGDAVTLEIGKIVPEYEITMGFDEEWGANISATVSYEFNKETKNLIAVLCQFDSSNKMVAATPQATTAAVRKSGNVTVTAVADSNAVNAKLYLWEGTDLVNTTMTSLKDFIELNKQTSE